MVDPSITIAAPAAADLAGLEEYQRWVLHGVEPNVALSPAELEDVFSPNRHRTGKATHQLLALYFYRKSQGASPELDRLMDKVERRIAWEAAVDFRVTDLYLQRIAFLLAAGRADLVQRRWVERALAAQQSDGGWLKDWHGWSPSVNRFSFRGGASTAHATVQGLWMGCMLKYRYAEWAEKNYR
jgi:hypothetical protein